MQHARTTQEEGITQKKTENKKSHPLIIGISGISGAGKSTLIKRLAKTLQSTPIFWDDYDEISKAPQSYVDWFYSSKDYNDWVYPELVDTSSFNNEIKQLGSVVLLQKA